MVSFELSVSSRSLLPKVAWGAGSPWWGKDSNLRRHQPADLQSAPFDRFGTSPAEISWAAPSRSTVFEVKIKSDETLPSRSLLLAIEKESGLALPVRPSRCRKTRPRHGGALAGGCYSYPVWLRVMIRGAIARP